MQIELPSDMKARAQSKMVVATADAMVHLRDRTALPPKQPVRRGAGSS
jgi:hypothetical protein